MKRCLVALVLLLGVSQLAFSQGFGTIVGTVADPSNASVAGAKVTITEAGTGAARDVVTNASGQFVIPGLRPTTYTITVQASGFNKYTQSNIGLAADQSETVNIALTVGQESQAVTVEATAIQADTYSSTLKEVVDSQRMVDLPLNGRNAANLTTMVPGAMLTPNGGADQGQTKTFPGAVTITTNGSRQNMVAYNLDGADNVDRYTNVNNPFPFPDALQEFSVQTSNYSAEYGGNAGAVVNVITKSGTNAFHGDAFGFLRNGDLNARNFFAKTADPLKRGQEGGTIGGPIKKNKTFFFAGWQFTSLRDVTNGLNKTVPTPAEETGICIPGKRRLCPQQTGDAGGRGLEDIVERFGCALVICKSFRASCHRQDDLTRQTLKVAESAQKIGTGHGFTGTILGVQPLAPDSAADRRSRQKCRHKRFSYSTPGHSNPSLPIWRARSASQ